MNSSPKCTLKTNAVLDLAIRPKARHDLREIWRYTRRTWSRNQADRYLAKLNEAIGELRNQPDLGKPSEDIAPGLRRRTAERHFIYFRVSGDALIVVRVLHDSMEPKLQFANDDSA